MPCCLVISWDDACVAVPLTCPQVTQCSSPFRKFLTMLASLSLCWVDEGQKQSVVLLSMLASFFEEWWSGVWQHGCIVVSLLLHLIYFIWLICQPLSFFGHHDDWPWWPSPSPWAPLCWTMSTHVIHACLSSNVLNNTHLAGMCLHKCGLCSRASSLLSLQCVVKFEPDQSHLLYTPSCSFS